MTASDQWLLSLADSEKSIDVALDGLDFEAVSSLWVAECRQKDEHDLRHTVLP